MTFLFFQKCIVIKIKERNAGRGSICAAAAAGNSPFAGPVPAVFRFVIDAWRKICGVLLAVGFFGNALIVVP